MAGDQAGLRFSMQSTRRNSLNKKRGPRMDSGRPKEKQLGRERAEPSALNAGPANEAPSLPAAQVSFFITQAQKTQLRERGYSDDQIAKMKPAEAHRILGLD
jgi:hypothetical protein